MNWESEARRILKAELARRGITYWKLQWFLRDIGVKTTERSIANKMSRGTFQFTFFLQCLKAIGVNSITFDITASPGGDKAPLPADAPRKSP